MSVIYCSDLKYFPAVTYMPTLIESYVLNNPQNNSFRPLVTVLSMKKMDAGAPS